MTRVVGEYVLGRQLGAGGMATVFQATHRATGALRALKLVDLRGPNQLEDMERFDREARTLAKVDRHPHVVRVHAHGRIPPGFGYCVLEWVDGEDLAGRLRRGPLPLEELLGILGPVTEALAHCHAEGIVHRDLKPANVLIRRDGHAFLTDFGVARDAVEARITQTQGLVGTPHYMSPEQCRGDGSPVGPAADVFALGLVLYEAAVGRLPFAGESALALMSARACGEGVRLELGRLPEDLGVLIERCVAVEPEERPSARVCAEALRAIGAGEASPLGQRPRRRRWWVGAAVVAVGVGLWGGRGEGLAVPEVGAVLEREGSWRNDALKGQRLELGETVALAQALGPDAPRANVVALLQAQPEAEAWRQVLLRLCVLEGEGWPAELEVSEGQRAEVEVCAGLGWLGGEVDVARVLGSWEQLRPGALREALERLVEDEGRQAALQREALSASHPRWVARRPAHAPPGLAGLAEALAERRRVEVIREGLVKLQARWQERAPRWESRSFYLELLDVIEQMVASVGSSHACDAVWTELSGTLAREASRVCLAATNIGESSGVAQAALDCLGVWSRRLDWEFGTLRDDTLELFQQAFLHDSEVLCLADLLLFVDASVWLDVRLFRLQLHRSLELELEEGLAACRDPRRFLLVAALQPQEETEASAAAAVSAAADALGGSLDAETRQRFGLEPARPLDRDLTPRQRLFAERLLLGYLGRRPRLFGGSTSHEDVIDLLMANVEAGHDVYPGRLGYLHASKVLESVRRAMEAGAPLESVARKHALIERARHLLDALLSHYEGLSAEERARPDRLALPKGEVSTQATVEIFRNVSLFLAYVWGQLDPPALEAYVRQYNRRRLALGFTFEASLCNWLLRHLLDTGRLEEVLQFSEDLLRSGGQVMPDVHRLFRHSEVRLHLYRGVALSRLGRHAEAAEALRSYESERDQLGDPDYDEPALYQTLRQRLAGEPGRSGP